MIDYNVLTHADVYLLLSIYVYELFRFLCEVQNPPEPRNVIPDFLNRDEVASAIQKSGFSLFSKRTSGTSGLNLFENIVLYYATIKRDYRKRGRNGKYWIAQDPCPKFRIFQTLTTFTTPGVLFLTCRLHP